MKINYIKLCNISSYYGESIFNFNITQNKNVILIGGQNGTGKTSLFTALKLALYGHLCFNYQSNNAMYLSKIKELINHDAFASDNVCAYVEVEIELPKERDFVKYTIRREWNFILHKISENLQIYQETKQLDNSEIVFFENFLFTTLPPNLFDFFFFDGEQIADFFSTNSYNLYVKNALLTLCSFDTFEIIRKFCNNYIDNDNLEENKSFIATYKDKLKQIEFLSEKLQSTKQYIVSLQNSLNELADRKDCITNDFKNSGGMTEKEKDELLKESRIQEKIKNEANLKTKNFVEGMMPFVITNNFSTKIKNQIDTECEYQKYTALLEKLNSTNVSKVITETLNSFNVVGVNSKLVNSLVHSISVSVKPNIDINDFTLLHDLSKEQQDKVYSILSAVQSFSSKQVLKTIKEKEYATLKTSELNKLLREAMSDIDTQKYSEQFDEISKAEIENMRLIDNAQAQLLADEVLLEQRRLECDNIKIQLQKNAKNRNIYELTNKINSLFDNMITQLTVSKFKEIETLMLFMLKKIMRKNNFIDLVELDDNFNILLYKEQIYKIADLENLIKNIGSDELIKRIGKNGVTKLLNFFEVDSISKIKPTFKKINGQLNFNSKKTIKLYKKLEFGQLSKGEKQIFILSLYFAIIKASKKDIPFIIDTPYARIDKEHREQISKAFFPTISNQVIILSTNEEITLPYYNVLKPYISKEYLLYYDEANSKTKVLDGYFYKE